MRRISAHRDEAEAPIVDALRRLGASVFLVTTRDAVDLVVGAYGITAVCEVKTGKRKLRPGQKVFAETWKGGPVWVLRTEDDAVRLVRWLTARATRLPRLELQVTTGPCPICKAPCAWTPDPVDMWQFAWRCVAGLHCGVSSWTRDAPPPFFVETVPVKQQAARPLISEV